MLTVTENAKQFLKETLAAHNDDLEERPRLILETSGQLGLALGIEGKDDQVIEHEGAKVLLISPEVASAVEQLTMDVENTADGPQLVVLKKRMEQEP
jgi:Fe-S cluster assembly iron-binding protein IscA